MKDRAGEAGIVIQSAGDATDSAAIGRCFHGSVDVDVADRTVVGETDEAANVLRITERRGHDARTVRLAMVSPP